MRAIRFEGSAGERLQQARSLEWLETNGIGGFASSTVAGLNARRYHGLLTAAVHPPVGRMVLLSKLEETLCVGGQTFHLSVNQYPGVLHPQGHQHLQEFRLDPFPTWVYEAGGVSLEKRLYMLQGENTTVIEYELRETRPDCVLVVRPLTAFRDFHALTHANSALMPNLDFTPGVIAFTPYRGVPTLFLGHDADRIASTGFWYYRFQYEMERDRGFDFEEDLFNPLEFEFHLHSRTRATIVSSTAPRVVSEVSRPKRSEPDTDLIPALKKAADSYIVQRERGQSIIAGYPWFADWGRDTMIALPGLALATGRHDTARKLLLTYAGTIDHGMLPNRFPDAGGAPEYNTVDAALWFFEAVRAYLEHTSDYTFVREHLYMKLLDIIEAYRRGTRHAIRAEPDGLLYCGERGVQLTWMDAKIGGWVVTPRTGMPVEIQALWYNAHRTLEDICLRFGCADRAATLGRLAGRLKDSFLQRFWNSDAGCLYDVLEGEIRDGSMRPNQIFAVSLRHSMLSPDQGRQVVEAVERELLTPLGLRSLSPRDRRYRGRYEGGAWDRDAAYHQGTVWPWLMGPFVSAYLKVHNKSEDARARVTEWLGPFRTHLMEAGLGHISEIADGDPPHTPRGCFAQAWSVAEILRAAIENQTRSGVV